jgi:UDP-N-acetylglucosamine--N-acetylmuramyl-(pentapeptide) pyrophosphoryl-undecaprenol N-acetylglucosamine transferase
VLPGRANASVFRFADKIAVSFEETKKRLGRFADKAVFTGNPIRASVLKEIDKTLSLKKLGLAPDKFTILVIGGSQGAHNLNSACLKAFAGLDKAKASNIQVIHITGQSDYAWASRSYEDAGIAHRVFSFIDEIEDAYSASDLVITRSGASAMFELAHYAKPMILVPYPFAMSHQAQNASVFSESGAAIKIEEKDISAGVVRNRVESLLSDPALLAGMAGKAKGLSVPDSAQRLAELLLNTAGK